MWLVYCRDLWTYWTTCYGHIYTKTNPKCRTYPGAQSSYSRSSYVCVLYMALFYISLCCASVCALYLLPVILPGAACYVALTLDKIKSAWSQITGFVYKPFYGAWQRVLIEAWKGKWLANGIMQQIFWRCQRVAVPTTVSNHFVKGGHTSSTGILMNQNAKPSSSGYCQVWHATGLQQSMQQPFCRESIILT